jgi:hypothetical protein
MHRLNIVIKHAAAMGLDVDIGAVERQKPCWVSQNNKSKALPATLPGLRCKDQTPSCYRHGSMDLGKCARNLKKLVSEF